MKIIHLISGNLGQGGAERLVMDLASAQARKGHDVTICSFRDYSGSYIDTDKRVKLHHFGKKKGISPRLPFIISSYLKQEAPDVVNCHLPAVFLYIIHALRVCRKIKFFYTIHSYPSIEEPRGWVRALRRHFIQKGILRFIAISDSIKTSFDTLYSVSGTAMIYNGRKPLVHSERFEEVKKEISSLKKDENTLVFVSAGRLVQQKNFPLMLEAFRNLENENIVLLILGAGNKEQYESIRPANAHVLGLRNNVADYMFCADAFCLSSRVEGFPITIIEAMSAGIPILSTRAGGVPDVVKDGVNGLLSDDMSVKAYIGMLKKFISLQRAEKERMAQKNSRDFAGKYDIDICADKYLEAYTH